MNRVLHSVSHMLASAAFFAGACAHTPPDEIVSARDLDEAASPPRITQIEELGGSDVMVPGRITAGAGDQLAVVGEGLWIKGSGFGRQPTVLVAGLPASIQARTADAGIVVRVPIGAPVGKQTLQVRTRAGVAEVPLNIRRYGAAWNHAGALQWIASPNAGGRAVVASPKGATPAVTGLAFSSDGRAAYTVDPTSRRLSVFDVTTQGGPLVAFTIELQGTPVVALHTAAAAPVLVLLRAQDIMVMRTTSAIRPPRSRPLPLPLQIQQSLSRMKNDTRVASALSPDGRFMALELKNENRIVLLSLTGEEAKIVSTVVLNDGVRASEPFDMAFSLQGDTLWVLSGARAGQEALGPQPTRIAAIAVRTVGGVPSLSVANTLDLAAGPPSALGVSRSQPLPSGAAIRRPPAVVQVFVAAAGQGANATLDHLWSLGPAGPASIAATEGRMVDLLIEPQGHFAFACVIDNAGAAKLAWLRADSRDTPPETTALWPAAANVTSCAIDVQP